MSDAVDWVKDEASNLDPTSGDNIFSNFDDYKKITIFLLKFPTTYLLFTF